jgi:hypothetical protein
VAQHGHAVQFRQVEVEDYHVIFELGGGGARLLAIGEYIHRIMLGFQTLTDEAG